jgi:tetratricopeptide (TPR) repeat protein
LWRGLAAVPPFLASLRKVMLDLTAVLLPVALAVFFVMILADDTIVVDVPSVPEAVEARGVTPELLTRLLQARVQQIQAAAQTGKATVAATPHHSEIANPRKTLEQVINEIRASVGAGMAEGVERDPRTAEADHIFGKALRDYNRSTTGDARPGEATSSVVTTRDSTASSSKVVRDEFDRLNRTVSNFIELEKLSPAELANPGQDPLVIETAGLHLSLNSLAQFTRRLLGMDDRRRLTVIVYCRTAECADDDLVLRAVALSGQMVTTRAVPLNVADPDPAIGAAAGHLLETFDRRVLATFHYRQGNMLKVRQLAELAATDPVHRTPLWAENLLGLAALRAGQWADAAGHFDAVLDSEPNYIPALINRGIVHYRNEDFDAARRRYLRVLELQPEHAVAHNNLGNALIRLCDWEGAALAYERSLAADPRSDSARRGWNLAKSFRLLSSFRIERPRAASGSAQPADSGSAIPAKIGSGGFNLEDLLQLASFCGGAGEKAASAHLPSE